MISLPLHSSLGKLYKEAVEMIKVRFCDQDYYVSVSKSDPVLLYLPMCLFRLYGIDLHFTGCEHLPDTTAQWPKMGIQQKR